MGSGKQHTASATTRSETSSRSDSELPRCRGIIQHVYSERGFGFIRCTEGPGGHAGHDFFFHMSGLDDGLAIHELTPGDLVEFEPWDKPKGKRAEHIQRAA